MVQIRDHRVLLVWGKGVCMPIARTRTPRRRLSRSSTLT